MEKRLYRDELFKKIGGVCAGLAEYLSIDVTIVRVIFVVGIFLKGVTLLPYFVLWIVLPKKPYHLNNPNVDYTVPPQNAEFNPFGAGVPPQPPFAMEPKRRSSAGLIAGIALVLFGSFFLLDEFNVLPFMDFGKLWPGIFIIIGAVMIFTGKDPKPVSFEKEKWDAAENKDDYAPAADNFTDNTSSTEQKD